MVGRAYVWILLSGNVAGQPFGDFLETSEKLSGLCRARFGGSWGHLRGVLEVLWLSWKLLEALGGVLEASWELLGALGAILEASWELLGPSWAHLESS